MRSVVVAVLLLGCGESKHTPPPVLPTSPAPTAVSVGSDAAVTPDAAAALDPADPNGPAAAVPIPDEVAPPALALIDTTITDGELAAITGWPAPKKSASGGEIWVVLHTAEDNVLELAVVRDKEGIRASYPLGKANEISTDLTYDGNAYPARDHAGNYQGPILFAARVTAPGATTPDQLAVFAAGSTLRVARRPLGAKDWKPVLSVAFKKGATFQAIGTTDPH